MELQEKRQEGRLGVRLHAEAERLTGWPNMYEALVFELEERNRLHQRGGVSDRQAVEEARKNTERKFPGFGAAKLLYNSYRNSLVSASDER